MSQIVKKDTLPESDEYGKMIYHAPSRTLRIFKNGSYKDFTAFEFVHDGEIDMDGDGIPDYLDPNLEDGPLADLDSDGVINLIDKFDNDPKKASGNDEDTDSIDDEFDDDDDGDGILDIYDSDHPDNDGKATGSDIDGDGIDDGLDPDPNDGPDGDLDGDSILNKDDTDKDNDGHDDSVDYDPGNPFVWSGDDDKDGTDSEIDPDDNDPEITISREPFKIVYDYNFVQNSPYDIDKYKLNINQLSRSSDILPSNVASGGGIKRRSVDHIVGAKKYSELDFPPEAQGQFVALVMATTNAATYSDHIVYNNTESELDALHRKLTTFFRVSTPNWNNLGAEYFYSIVCVPYYDKNNQFLSNPIEWNGFYPLYQTQEEANLLSPTGSSHSHTFNWNAGELNQGSDQIQANVTRTFYMPDGLEQATTETSKRKYATHFWHGDHPGLDVFSQILGLNQQSLAWDRIKDYTSTNTPSVVLSNSLKTLKENIDIT